MEQVKDFRLTTTPQILLIICGVLLVLRVGLTIYEFVNPVKRGRPVAWTEAVNAAPVKSDSKDLKLYEFYAAWCSPCERLERDVMTNDEIRNQIEGNFAPLRVTDRQREDGKNPAYVTELQKKYRVFAFPTLVAVGPDGEPISQLVGNSNSLAVYRFLTKVQSDAKSLKK